MNDPQHRRKKERTWEIRWLISKIANPACHERELFTNECGHVVEDALQDLFIMRGRNCTFDKIEIDSIR